ncbi:MAG: redox-regulated ATPase YchF [Deltaproteobacteria bacterium RIFCSPLOWO2_12_FULL_50_11]|nr:MAG: redox-regulated ATPase YchF [Deltaproteobacteria bacterium RIFCSPLOWO2_12_FULL_50_11]
MGFQCGIVGLPNVGKSTIFNAMTAAGVAAENYPFCTIEPNVGIVPLRDPRLDNIARIFKPKKVTPTVVEFVDIAGLVKGASQGEGLGNQFLGHIRNVNAVAHVVRCFEDPDVVHVHEVIDPRQDIEIINTELILADLDSIQKRLEKVDKMARVGDKEAKERLPLYERVHKALNEGHTVRSLDLSDEERGQLADCFLLTIKPTLYVANVSEEQLKSGHFPLQVIREMAQKEKVPVIVISGKIESEIALLEGKERQVFLEDLGLKESGLDQLGHAGYRLLNLITFFTAGEPEARAWTVTRGTKAPQAAGVIHSDFEKGFIKAEVYHYEDLMEFNDPHKAQAAGRLRLEGKDYVIQDGDIVYFRFNI